MTTIRARLGAALEERIALLAPSRRLRLALVNEELERFASGRPIRALDAGCGDGLLALAIASGHPDWTVVGVDVGEDPLTRARARATAERLSNVSFERADLTEPLPQTAFDAVLAIECLVEIPEDQRALQMLAAAVTPGGLLIAHVPELSWRPILRSSDPTWRHEVRHGYTAEQLTAMLQGAGLRPTDIRPTFRGTAVLAQELRDRIKQRTPAVRALAFPAMAAAVSLERAGITWGPPHALFAVARR